MIPILENKKGLSSCPDYDTKIHILDNVSRLWTHSYVINLFFYDSKQICYILCDTQGGIESPVPLTQICHCPSFLLTAIRKDDIEHAVMLQDYQF